MRSEIPPYATLAPRPLRPEALALQGLSQRQIEAHFAVYAGEITQLNVLHLKLQTEDIAIGEAERAELKLAQARLFNAVKLHEAYLEALAVGTNIQSGMRSLLERDFGSVDKWQRELQGLATNASGWVTLGYDGDDCRLHNFVAVAVWNAVPILALDLHDHAYDIDYGANREAYVVALLKNVDWLVVERRVRRLQSSGA